jgi:putative tricarboxylic transport membrane protein
VSRLNRDSVVAAVLLIAGGALYWDTYQWRHAPYATMPSNVWPRFVLIVFFALCALYLLRSLTKGAGKEESRGGILRWLGYYRNPLWCFGLFFLFLMTMPYFGMLIGGILFVWAVQVVLGEKSLQAHLRHAAIAIGSVGFMWLVFTYAIDVILPAGRLFHI